MADPRQDLEAELRKLDRVDTELNEVADKVAARDPLWAEVIRAQAEEVSRTAAAVRRALEEMDAAAGGQGSTSSA